MKLFAVVFLLTIPITMMSQKTSTIFDFSKANSESEWTIVNDGVMGGISRSQFKVYEDETAVFNGIVSLENNGGFASVRTVPQKFELNDYNGIILRVKGDGLQYKFRLRTDGNFDGVAYSKNFRTVENEWIEIKLPFDEFSPQFRGRILSSVKSVDPADIKQIGILIADKQTGEFNLIIDWIRAYKN